MNRQWKWVLAGILLLATNGHAATIEGSAYDGLTLDVLPHVVVSITTSPVQTKLVREGMYSFDVPPGTYTLRATYSEQGIVLLEASQLVEIVEEGTYTIDLILLPDLGEIPDEPLPGDTPIPGWIDQLVQGPLIWLLIVSIILVAAGYAIATVRKSERPTHEKTNENVSETRARAQEPVQLDQYAHEILDHLKRGGNRTTQKELRGMMKIGEAKVSLVVSELESYGLLKKIKRGRGNILVLTEKGRAEAEKKSGSPATSHAPPDPSEPAH